MSQNDDDDLAALLEPRETIRRLRAEAEAAKQAARQYRDRLAEHEPQANMSQAELGDVMARIMALPDDEANAEMERLGFIDQGGDHQGSERLYGGTPKTIKRSW